LELSGANKQSAHYGRISDTIVAALREELCFKHVQTTHRPACLRASKAKWTGRRNFTRATHRPDRFDIARSG
jgi:hypothetical protein